MKKNTIWKRYSYVWVTLIFFIFSFIGHWTAAWYAYVEEQKEFNQPIEVNQYVVQTLRDTFENWQSEFLQLIWQVAGLAYLWYVGSPQSKEGDDRKEEKIDFLIKKVAGKEGEKVISSLDKRYSRKE